MTPGESKPAQIVRDERTWCTKCWYVFARIVWLSFFQKFFTFIFLFASLSLLCIHLSVSLSVCLSVCLSLCLSLCFTVCLSVSYVSLLSPSLAPPDPSACLLSLCLSHFPLSLSCWLCTLFLLQVYHSSSSGTSSRSLSLSPVTPCVFLTTKQTLYNSLHSEVYHPKTDTLIFSMDVYILYGDTQELAWLSWSLNASTRRRVVIWISHPTTSSVERVSGINLFLGGGGKNKNSFESPWEVGQLFKATSYGQDLFRTIEISQKDEKSKRCCLYRDDIVCLPVGKQSVIARIVVI